MTNVRPLFQALLNNVNIIDVCDVTLSVYPHWASLKIMPGHGGNRTYDLWSTSPMLCQLSYAVRSVRVCDISELNLVPSISILLLLYRQVKISITIQVATKTTQPKPKNQKIMCQPSVTQRDSRSYTGNIQRLRQSL